MNALDKVVKEGIKTLERSAEKKIRDVIKNDKRRTLNSSNAIFISKKIKSDITKPVVPRNPEQFYKFFGQLPHPFKKDAKGQPLLSPNLAPYQIDAWKHKGNLLVIKSNKIGLTTSFSLEDIQSRLLPEEAGYDCLLVAQNQDMANEHIRDLKNLIRNSKTCAKYLIEKPTRDLMKEEASKVSVAYIHNPYNPKMPSRIIGLGASEKSVFSWKRVNRIHMSDVSIININSQKEFFGGLYSRLANTNGVVKIETIPGPASGEVYRIYLNFTQTKLNAKTSIDKEITKTFAEDQANISTTFKVMEINVEEGIQAGIVNHDYIEKQRIELPQLQFEHLYMCKFITPGNQWFKEEWMKTGRYTVGDW